MWMASVLAYPLCSLGFLPPRGHIQQTTPTCLGMEENEKPEKYMKSIKLTLALALALAAMPLASHAYVWSSCAQYGTYSSGGYEFYCDEWGSTASECLQCQQCHFMECGQFGAHRRRRQRLSQHLPETTLARPVSSLHRHRAVGAGALPAARIGTPRLIAGFPPKSWSGKATAAAWVRADPRSIPTNPLTAALGMFTGRVAAPCPSSGRATPVQARQNLGTFFRWGASKGYFSSGGTIGGVGFGFEIFGSGSSHTWYVNSVSIGT